MSKEKKESSTLSPNKKLIPEGYKKLLDNLKTRIRSAQIKAAIKVNEELIKLYWEIGQEITERQDKQGWGTQVIEHLAKDLQNSFPGVGGFSRTNVFRMRAFYLAYQKVPQAVGQLNDLPVFRIPWGHNAVIIEKLVSTEQRLWYAEQTLINGWSRSSLEDWIKSDLINRQGKAITNFAEKLPLPQSHLAHETLKDPYNFEFLTLADGYREQELEKGLLKHIQKFLIELGQGFAFIGSQYPLEVGGKDYYLDLLFYHISLRCFIVIELKNTDFKPEYAGKMNFYLSAVDDRLKHPTDNPSIGMILCKTKNNFTVEYALRDIHKPMGVAGYETKIMESLPQDLRGSLPTVEEFEAELTNE
ncbi:MAG: PDDEXK nuclease domain-containing protein [Chlamydiales bacterium]|nr:PDDEXK nuclease domain-containing protein [Chlamydiales bacterium]